MVARWWFAFLGGPIAWVLHLSVSYFIVALGCNTGASWTDGALLGSTLLFGAVALLAGLIALNAWRRTPENFFMVVGMPAAGLFLFLIILNGLAPFFVPTCSAALE